MGATDGVILVVDDRGDQLAGLVADTVRRHRRAVRHVLAERLGLLRVHLSGDGATVDGQRLDAILFRASPWSRFDRGFAHDDASFATAEVTATWLAITRLPSVNAVNRLHPEASTTLCEWPVWRRYLSRSGVAQVNVGVGDVDGSVTTWLPWGGGMASAPGGFARRAFAPALTSANVAERTLWLDGDQLTGHPSPHARQAAERLAEAGVRLAGILTDAEGRVVTATARPTVADDHAALVADRVAQALAS